MTFEEEYANNSGMLVNFLKHAQAIRDDRTTTDSDTAETINEVLARVAYLGKVLCEETTAQRMPYQDAVKYSQAAIDILGKSATESEKESTRTLKDILGVSTTELDNLLDEVQVKYNTTTLKDFDAKLHELVAHDTAVMLFFDTLKVLYSLHPEITNLQRFLEATPTLMLKLKSGLLKGTIEVQEAIDTAKNIRSACASIDATTIETLKETSSALTDAIIIEELKYKEDPSSKFAQ